MTRLFLDTNVYILGSNDSQSDEGLILTWLGFRQSKSSDIEVVISQELLDQVSRVAKRLRSKDWSGELIDRIWQNLNVHYVLLEASALATLEQQAIVPREDIGVYLTAKVGKANCFVSSNHKLIRSLVQETQEFECLTPSEFVEKYLRN